MKKFLLIGGIVVAVLAALGVAGYAYAQSQLPEVLAYGMMRGYGRHGGMMGRWDTGNPGAFGPLHEYMVQAMEETFDITSEEIQQAFSEGKTIWDIAEEKGLTEEEIRSLMIEARTKALEAAVADGVITQEQADWMLERMNQMWQYGGGFGPCGGGRFGGRGPGGRWNTQPSGPGF